MTKKIYYSWNDINHQVADLAHKIITSEWKPDYIVGLTRGGVTPAVMLSHYLGVRMHTLDVRLRDGDDVGPESNCWMADDAYGYDEDHAATGMKSNPDLRTKILIVDDINDTGATFEWIKQDWPGSCMPKDEIWSSIWHDTVRFAVLTNNLSSRATVDYWATEVNKAEDDCWLVYPWEEWWKI